MSTVVATLGGAVTLARRDLTAGARWQIEPVADGTAFRSVIAGELALRRGEPVALLIDFDASAMTYALTYREGGRSETIVEGCASSGSMSLIATEPSPIVTHGCAGPQLVVRRDGATWKTLATLDQLLGGARAGNGDIVLVSGRLDADGRYWTLRDGVLTEATMPSVSWVKDLAACGGRVYAFVERPGQGADGDGLAAWTGADWQFEAIPVDYRGVTTIGFDEACHPFVAIHDRVWSRGRAGWVASRSLPRDASVRALAAHRGVLYVLSTFVADGQRAALASIPVRPD